MKLSQQDKTLTLMTFISNDPILIAAGALTTKTGLFCGFIYSLQDYR